jgi:uncharacterized paraquat-inducible protein A
VVGAEHLRWAAVALFAAGAVLSGVGNESGLRFVVALAAVCFGLGVICVLRARAAIRARVLAREEKTPSERP